MDIFNKRIMVLNEADRADKYDIDQAEDDVTDAQDDENTDTNAQPSQDNEQTDDTTNNQQQEEQTDSDQEDTNQESDPEQPSEDEYLNEELPNRMSIPQIDIMDGMSEIEHSLNNLKLLEQFNELHIKVKDCLYGNTISNISVKNAKGGWELGSVNSEKDIIMQSSGSGGSGGSGGVVPDETFNNFPEVGEKGKIYIDTNDQSLYLWDETSSSYILVGSGYNNLIYSGGDAYGN